MRAFGRTYRVMRVAMPVQITFAKIIAAIIASGYVVAMLFAVGGATVEIAKTSLALLVPIALIWFPEELGDFTGSVGRGGFVNSRTPAVLLSAMGWFLLVGFPAVIYWLR
mgnify:CR=1 FL=1